MAPFLLFVFMFASQLIAGFNTQLPPPVYGNLVTILNIDGGGIKGIIPAVVLDYLDKALKAKDENASIAHYFDVIAGTSTGGLVTAMLTSPDPNHPNRPLLTPGEIIQFYKKYGPSIFNETSGWNKFYPGPKYDGNFLHEIARENLKETRLSQTLTNVVIPTFDLKKLQPVIFSNFKLDRLPSLDAKLSDICIGTSAAPTIFPPYYFKNDDTEFNLVDGAVAATIPALAAISEVIQQQKEKNPDLFPVKANENTTILLLSVGTGATKVVEKYNATIAASWSTLDWLTSGVVFESLGDAAVHMTDYYLATVFPGLQAADNYLRIQEYNLDPSLDAIDNATPENMDNLEKAGKNLLEQKVLRVNVDTFVPEETNQGTNAEALDRLAEILYKVKQLRLKKKSMGKKERPLIETVTIPFTRTRTI